MKHRRWLSPKAFVTVAALGTAALACTTRPADEGGATSISELSNALCADAPGWNTSAFYPRGTMVRYGAKVYECIQSHTSLPGWTPDVVPALWGETFCGSGGGTSGGSTGSGPIAPPPAVPPPAPPPPTTPPAGTTGGTTGAPATPPAPHCPSG